MNAILRFDNKVTFWFQGWPAFLHPYMLIITQLGSVAWIAALSLILATTSYIKHKYSYAIAFALVIPGELFNSLLKLIFNRVRPDTMYAHHMFLQTKSFPSGHAFGSMLLYGLLAYMAFTHLPKEWNVIAAAALLILILLIGISRIYLGAHYSFDVLGGWLLGAIILGIVIKLTNI